MEAQSKRFMEDIIKMNATIYMDTASLMETERLEKLVENYRDVFLSNKKTITIPEVVCQELVRHLTSSTNDKVYKANKALMIMRENGEIFSIETAGFSNEELRKAFADREILLKLSEGRGRHRQLLITNDRKLSKDAYSLNNFESCFGKPVSVCYLNPYGELIRADYIERHEPMCSEITPKIKIVEKVKTVCVPVKEEHLRKNTNIIGWLAMAAITFMAGYETRKYGNTAANYLRRIF